MGLRQRRQPCQPDPAVLDVVRGRSPGRSSAVRTLLRQTITREQALAAHTRRNAYLLFRERDLGSIEAGKLADLAVLDRDYLTVPADQIKDITSVMTIVGGRVVHGHEVLGP